MIFRSLKLFYFAVGVLTSKKILELFSEIKKDLAEVPES